MANESSAPRTNGQRNRAAFLRQLRGIFYNFHRDGLKESLERVASIRRELSDHNLLIEPRVAHPVCFDCHFRYLEVYDKCSPDISMDNWTQDLLLWGMDCSTIDDMKEAIENGVDPVTQGPYCYGCRKTLPYWEDEDATCFVITESLRDYIGFEARPIKGRVPKYLKKLVLEVYGRQCFNCGTSRREDRITIDHIHPRNSGGTADLYNLQPLCKNCNNAKDDHGPRVNHLVLHFPLRPIPSDAYEGKMW